MLAALGVAVWFSIVLARADFYFRGRNAQRAVEIAPRNTEYLALRALQLDYDGADSRAVTEQVARLNPYSSAPRIRLGLAAEVSGDAVAAERWLLDAARVDHQFEPRWTLANFYFRAGKTDEFWRWIRSALEVSYGDRTPAYELCWRVDGAEVLQRAIPDRHEVVGSYLVYLLNKNRQGLVEVARKVASYRDAADLPLLLAVCDRLIDARDAEALEVWSLAGESAPSGIFNGDFATLPLNHGFDWRLIESPGVRHLNNRIALSGSQAESVVLLQQVLNVVLGKRYRLSWEARTVGIKSPSGLGWRVAGNCSPLPDGRGSVGRCEGEDGGLLPSQDWSEGGVTFVADAAFTELALVYQRPVGESRAEGHVELRHIRLVAL